MAIPAREPAPLPDIGSPERVDLDLGAGAKMALVRIPARGKTFWMGSPRAEPNHQAGEEQREVEFSHDYWLGEFKVTQKQYKALLKEDNSSTFRKGNPEVEKARVDPDQLPVDNVDWGQAKSFCARLTERFKADLGFEFRLPTEAEWECACCGGTRSGDTQSFYLRDGRYVGLLSGQVNFDWSLPGGGKAGPPLGRTSVRGEFPESVNALGLWDMHGNVTEWCEDFYDPAFYSKTLRLDPLCDKEAPGNQNRRVRRGGSYGATGPQCSAGSRNWGGGPNSTTGFRVCAVRAR
jgi:formylglycine-generating enzyme required for sulfatase activity